MARTLHQQLHGHELLLPYLSMRDALVDCAAELTGQPWDAVIRPPGDDPLFREAVFGSGCGSGILGFYLDDDAQLIRIFDIVCIG